MINVHCKEINKMWYGVAIEGEKIFATAFSSSEEEVLRSLLESLPYDMPFQMAEKSSRFSTKVLETMKEIFDGKDSSAKFSLAMDHLSSYTRKVLKRVSLIPVGYVTTYGAVAKVAGGSPRAVGQALASNPFPLLIPCHRVVYADFSIGGFSGYGGVKTKREILRREDRDYKKSMQRRVDNKVLSLFSVNLVLHTKDAERVQLNSQIDSSRRSLQKSYKLLNATHMVSKKRVPSNS